MTPSTISLSQRERELAAIITAYNEVTEQLKRSHESLNHEVVKLRVELQDKNLELARRERLAALGEMATGVAHEIRNPLGSIQLYASLLDRDLSALPDAQRLVRKIASGVDALEKIVGGILDFGGSHAPDIRAVPLQVLIANVFDLATAPADRKQVDLAVDTSILTHELRVDPAMVERALLNVVLNGVDAVGSGGRIEAAADRAADGMIAVHIRDNGSGIDPSVMQRIFNPFFTTKDTGTGLGLAIVHRICESHGGRVTVRNLGNGGACFTLHLPGPEAKGRAHHKEPIHGAGLRRG